MNFSDYLEQALLGHTLLQSTFTAPGTTYLALATAITTTASEIAYTEVTTNIGYNRRPINWSSITSQPDTTVVSSATITFSPATTPWGGVGFVLLFDAETIGTGNLLYWGDMTSVRTVETNDILEFQAGNLSVRLD